MIPLLVTGGKGGTGKTTIACNLAVDLGRRKYKVSVFDADFSTPTCHRLLKQMGEIGEDPKKMMLKPVETKYENVWLFSTGLVFGDETGITWIGEDIRSALSTLYRRVDWNSDFLVVDMPPSSSDELISIIEEAKKYHSPLAVPVTIPTETAHLALNRCLDILEAYKVPVLLVIENFSGVFSKPLDANFKYKFHPLPMIPEVAEHGIVQSYHQTYNYIEELVDTILEKCLERGVL